MTAEIPEELVSYLAARDHERAERVTDALYRRSAAELKLMKEVAAMGYVLGKQAPRDADVPGDWTILRTVVAACLDLPDLYPAVSAPESPSDASTAPTRPESTE